MMYEKKWVLRLHNPMIIGANIDGIDRDEVIDTITVSYLPAGQNDQTAEDVVRMWKAIDWDRSEPMLMEEFEACDLNGAVHEASRDARRRAEAYCAAVLESQAHGYTLSHSQRKANVRLAADSGETVS